LKKLMNNSIIKKVGSERSATYRLNWANLINSPFCLIFHLDNYLLVF
jgi:hypothetical protein